MFRDEIKAIFNRTGGPNEERIVFLMTDNQII